jgi:hypothetical protein
MKSTDITVEVFQQHSSYLSTIAYFTLCNIDILAILAHFYFILRFDSFLRVGTGINGIDGDERLLKTIGL